jgi:hypothetical protein
MHLITDPGVIVFIAGQFIALIGWMVTLNGRVARLEESGRIDAATNREILEEVKALRAEVTKGAIQNEGLRATVEALRDELRGLEKRQRPGA